MRTIALTVAALLLTSPVVAQTAGSGGSPESATKARPTGTSGNGVTTSTTSDPQMKTGAERSPTAGAPTSSGVTGGDAHK